MQPFSKNICKLTSRSLKVAFFFSFEKRKTYAIEKSMTSREKTNACGQSFYSSPILLSICLLSGCCEPRTELHSMRCTSMALLKPHAFVFVFLLTIKSRWTFLQRISLWVPSVPTAGVWEVRGSQAWTRHARTTGHGRLLIPPAKYKGGHRPCKHFLFVWAKKALACIPLAFAFFASELQQAWQAWKAVWKIKFYSSTVAVRQSNSP